MFFDETRAALFTLLGQPIAVASAVLLAGLNAAIWLLVFQRTGFPTALASLLIVPPFTFLLPLYFAFAQWPSQRLRFPTRVLRAATRPVQHRVPRRPVDRSALEALDFHRPLRLAADGLPRVRIPLPQPGSSFLSSSTTPSGAWNGSTDFLSRDELARHYQHLHP